MHGDCHLSSLGQAAGLTQAGTPPGIQRGSGQTDRRENGAAPLHTHTGQLLAAAVSTLTECDTHIHGSNSLPEMERFFQHDPTTLKIRLPAGAWRTYVYLPIQDDSKQKRG